MGGKRRGEVSVKYAARILGMNPVSVHRWCRDHRLDYVRAELGARRPDGSGRIVKRYWLSRAEIDSIAAEQDGDDEAAVLLAAGHRA